MIIIAIWILFIILLLRITSCVAIVSFLLLIKVDYNHFKVSLTLSVIDSCRSFFFVSTLVTIFTLLSSIIVASLSFYLDSIS